MTRVCLTCGEPYTGRLDMPLQADCENCGEFRSFGVEAEYEYRHRWAEPYARYACPKPFYTWRPYIRHMSRGIADFDRSKSGDSTARGLADFADDTGSMGLSDFAGDGDSLDLKVTTVEYTDNDHGTVIHLFGRDENGDRRHIEVTGHYPSFYIREEAYNQRIDNHYAVHHTETHDEDGERYTDLHDRPLVRVYTHKPSQVGEMRELFEWTGEADVFYRKRWMIDEDIYTGVRVDLSDATRDEPWLKGECRVHTDDVTPLSLDETPSVMPKQVVLDIEVAGEDGVPDADRAEYPVSTIVAWDTDEQRYHGWILHNDTCEWSPEQEFPDDQTELDEVYVFEDESKMLYDFNEWVRQREPDVLTGWYSNDFDLPYLVNRSRKLNTYNYQQWSPLGDVYLSKFDPVVKGVECIDMLEAYKKTQIHKLKSKKLDTIAEKELGKSKVEHDLSHTEMWRQEPVDFLYYNKVDVELVHDIDEEVGVIEMLDNLRAVTGVFMYDAIGGNIDMMDMVFLRKAQDYGYALPTAEKPEVGDYHGAYVFTPASGLHEHVVYPDYSSLYPNMMYQCNISPETLVGTEDDLEASEYTEDDCVWTYVDMTTPPALKEDVEATEERMERLYFLKPSVKTGFIRSVLDDIMGMCDQYTGDMYDAAKRVRNSTYGVLGDSDSYGRGFRLFDWRLAEGTTLGGQKVLKAGAEKFIEEAEDDEAYIVGGDTDSVMTAFPSAEDGEHALEMAFAVTDTVNEWLDEYAAETFGLESAADARMELELESYAGALFFKGQDGGKSEDGVKKRYVQRIEWDEDDGWLEDPSIGIKGFEYVRSDVAAVTADVQFKAFENMMNLGPEEAEEATKEHVTTVITQIMEGDYDMDDVGIPFGISQSLDQYGSTDRRPQPQYRGAKFANTNIYGGDAIEDGDKPLYYYIQEGKTGSSLRSTYKAHTAEDGDYVDCISVLEWRDMPEDVRVDREKMVTKTIIDPMKEIFRTLGWGVDWMQDAIEDAKPPEAYRDEGQTGFEQFGVDEERRYPAQQFM